MPESQYSTLPSTVLAYKKDHKIGRFDPRAPEIQARKAQEMWHEVQERRKSTYPAIPSPPTRNPQNRRPINQHDQPRRNHAHEPLPPHGLQHKTGPRVLRRSRALAARTPRRALDRHHARRARGQERRPRPERGAVFPVREEQGRLRARGEGGGGEFSRAGAWGRGERYGGDMRTGQKGELAGVLVLVHIIVCCVHGFHKGDK